ncbi:MAG TPA: DUF4129 domain-containing protein [Candidatus Limnocylindrales bacterium]|nr:DUF4129 domain-containing protein [Candidatus Limnocylindrales bacterium]
MGPEISATRSLRRWVPIPVAIGCLAVAAFASRVTPMAATLPVPALDVLTPIEVLGYVGLGVGVVLLPWVAVERARRRLRPERSRRAPGEGPGIPRWAQALGLLVVLAIVALQGAAVAVFFGQLIADRGSGVQRLPDGTPGQAGGGVAGSHDPTSLVIAAVILVGLAVLSIGLLAAWRRSDAAEASSAGGTPGSAVRRAVELSLDALRREPDPRLAVIAAYGAMEQSMASVGLERVASEAPVAYLRRIVARAVPAAHAATTISNLFQVAKFSSHPVDEPMRGAAIEALERVRSDTGHDS